MVLECRVCTYKFDSDTRKPVIGTCGHTICIFCRNGISVTGYNCPTCQCTSSFINPVTNYQMIELIEDVTKIQLVHEEALTDLKSNVDTLTKSRKDAEEELERERKNKEQIEIDNAKQLEEKNKCIEDLNRKVEQSIADDERFNESRWTCSECKGQMEQAKGRICLQCCDQNGALMMGDGQFRIKDAQLADGNILCASCFLEGPHKGHHSSPYLNLKLLHRSSDEFSLLLENLTKCGEAQKVAGDSLLNIVTGFVELMEKLREKARTQQTLPDYEDLLEGGDNIQSEVTKLAELHLEHIGQMTTKFKVFETMTNCLLNDEPFPKLNDVDASDAHEVQSAVSNEADNSN